MTAIQVKARQPNKDQSLIKLVAILTMIVDHTGAIFFPGILWLRMIGRIAFPLFCWGIVIGQERTHNWALYALRLFIMAIVTQPFFTLALRHWPTAFSLGAILLQPFRLLFEVENWTDLNVMFTLLLALLSIQGIKMKWYFSQFWLPALCLFLAASFRMDYGWRGVLLVILMYLAKDSRGGLAALMVAFCLYWGGGRFLPSDFVTSLTSTSLPFLNRGISEFLSLFKLQSLAILALPLMLIDTKSGLKLPKWFSYLAYPGHLAVLWIISLLLAFFAFLG